VCLCVCVQFEEQADGNMALVLDDEECLRMCLGPSHGLAKWTLDKSDGKVHSYTSRKFQKSATQPYFPCVSILVLRAPPSTP
jgi:hypothetical protein